MYIFIVINKLNTLSHHAFDKLTFHENNLKRNPMSLIINNSERRDL